MKTFNRNDEQFLEAFAIFCGLGIQNTQMYERVERAMAKQEVTLEVSHTRVSWCPVCWRLKGSSFQSGPGAPVRPSLLLPFIHW